MDLLKISVSKNAMISRQALARRGTNSPAPWAGKDVDAWLPGPRCAADNIRLALAYRLRSWQRFEHAGMTCKAVATPTKDSKGLDIWIYVQRRGMSKVVYSDEAVLHLIGKGRTAEDVTLEISTSTQAYGDLVGAIGSAQSLDEFGARHFFENDLRTLCKGMLEAVCVPLWPGVMLALSAEAREIIEALSSGLMTLDAGTCALSCLSLDNTPVNRDALARELAGGFVEQLETLTERLGFVAPKLEEIQEAYEAICARIDLVQDILEVEVDCLDAQFAVEQAMSMVALA